jgi:small subunit ribosomal protein S8
MPRTDFIGDFLTMIRNASKAGKDKVTVPASKFTVRVAEILKEEGFVQQTRVFAEGKKVFVRIHLKYLSKQKPAIQGLRRLSKPGLRRYVGVDRIPQVRGGLGISILSTSKGIMCDRQARESKSGGELVCSVW